MVKKEGKRVILGITGSIAAYKGCDIARRLMDHGLRVDVAMTQEATRLVSPTTLAALTGHRVYHDMWDEDAWQMAHIDLAQHASAFVIAPATANTIAKLAHGFSNDCVTSLALATQAPLIIAPAMNDVMYANAMVTENIKSLKKHGAVLIHPVKGLLACGVVGEGHLADVEDIVKAVLKVL